VVFGAEPLIGMCRGKDVFWTNDFWPYFAFAVTLTFDLLTSESNQFISVCPQLAPELWIWWKWKTDCVRWQIIVKGM